MLQSASRAFFSFLAESTLLKKLASHYAMAKPQSFTRRFIAGETVADVIDAARAIEARGLMQTLDHLGERVTNLAEAETTTREYLEIIDAVIAAGVGRNLSLKLTQLGVDVDKAMAVDNLRKILERAEPARFFIRIDMENSPYTDVTLEIFETLWDQGHRQLGVVLQAALRRSETDLARLMALGARVRLVKGAYREPKSIAYPRKAEVDAAYARMIDALLAQGHYPAIATHDPAMIARARNWADAHHVGRDRFEFQMLYGVRRDLQAALVEAGYLVRVYMPFGRDWFPYFMRRLAERPANVAFAFRSLSSGGGGT